MPLPRCENFDGQAFSSPIDCVDCCCHVSFYFRVFSVSWPAAFLHQMREYMPPHHQALVREIRSSPSLRHHISSSGSEALQAAYNQCVAALCDLRTYHITMVTRYVVIAAHNVKTKPGPAPLPIGPPSFLERRGTGGSGILSFLKNVRDTTREATMAF